MTDTFKAEVLKHIYSKETFHIMTVKLLGGEMSGKTVSVLGHYPAFCSGVEVEVQGTVVEHSSRGTQIKATQVLEIVPTTEEGLISYLGGGTFPGIGKGYARRIVNTFGAETQNVLSNEPIRLLDVEKVPPRLLHELISQWQARRDMHETVTYFRKAGLGEALCLKVYEKWHEASVSMVKDNPYCLMVIDGIGFQTADLVGLKLGLPGDSPHRIQAAIMHVMDGVTEEGDTCITGRDLYFKVKELLEDVEDLRQLFMGNLNSLIDRRAMYSEKSLGESVFYKFHMAHKETELSLMFQSLVATEPDRKFDDTAISRSLAAFEQAVKITLSPKQREAVHAAARSSVVVITGGPGTGKTTVLSALLDALNGCLASMAAPTGKAANVMRTATGYHSSTIHKLLEWSAEEGDFTRNRRNPLEGDLIVIDEMSMLDLPLASCLMDAINPGSRLVLIGDVDQLPSVGPGAVLRDIIRSGLVPVVRLDHVYRQGAGSGIAHNAQRILRGQPLKNAEDFFVLPGHDDLKARDRVIELVTGILPRKFGLDPKNDIQVLVPKHKGDAGRLELNIALQEAINPASGNELELMFMGTTYRKGDRVMQLKNQSTPGGQAVFNGEIGLIQEVDKDTLRVLYPGARESTYTRDTLDQLTLAYASTAHKSQGGEYPAVVIVILGSAGWMLNKNLLYTAVTRARKVAVIVTDEGAKAVDRAISKSGSERVTKLAERLTRKEASNEQQEEKEVARQEADDEDEKD